jgi:predicted membrane channel-forming protein YqfA (hemolysin III family)
MNIEFSKDILSLVPTTLAVIVGQGFYFGFTQADKRAFFLAFGVTVLTLFFYSSGFHFGNDLKSDRVQTWEP